MKKTLVFILLLSMILLVGCQREPKLDLTNVYEIDEQTLGVVDASVNHQNVVSEKATYYTDAEAEGQMVYDLLGESLALSYEESLYYPVGDIKCNVYAIAGTEKGKVLLDADGMMNSIIAYPIAKIEIKPDDTTDEVRLAVVAALAELIDLSSFEHCEVTTSPGGNDPIESYFFYFQNKIQDYVIENTLVLVKRDGTIRTIRRSPSQSHPRLTDLRVSSQKEEQFLQEKLKNMYTTAEAEVGCYEICEACVVYFEGEACILYSVMGDLVDAAKGGDLRGFACKIMIPIRLLTE